MAYGLVGLIGQAVPSHAVVTCHVHAPVVTLNLMGMVVLVRVIVSIKKCATCTVKVRWQVLCVM